MLACYDGLTGEYITNEQSWACEPRWPEGTVVLEAGQEPWFKKVVEDRLVEDAEKVAHYATVAAERETEEKVQKQIALAQRIASLKAARGELAGAASLACQHEVERLSLELNDAYPG